MKIEGADKEIYEDLLTSLVNSGQRLDYRCLPDLDKNDMQTFIWKALEDYSINLLKMGRFLSYLKEKLNLDHICFVNEEYEIIGE